MRVLAIIPARGGSKGVKRKNIKLLGEKPLIQYTIESAKQAIKLSKIMVSTDDEEIAEFSRSLEVEVPELRPKHLASDNSPTIDTVIYTLEYYQKEKNEYFDAVCLLQPTYPFRKSNSVDEAIQTFIEKGTDSLISVVTVPHEYNPHWVFVENEVGHLKIATGESTIITRRQALPEAYIRDGSIYITRVPVVLESKSLYGTSTCCYKSDTSTYVNIDTIEDWKKAEGLLRKHD